MTMSERTHGEGAHTIITRPATTDDLAEVRALMIRTFDEDFGYGYNPAFHADVDDMQGTYLDNPRHTLFVAVEPATGQILGTAEIRSGGLKPAFNESWLVARYDPERTAQIVRVYTLREARGRGVARALVGRVTAFAAAEGGYTVVALHTDPRSPGAERFWRSMPTTLILDDRDGPSESLHFEMAMLGQGTSTPAEGEQGDDETTR
jgi:ribosomal protein S18 acetylase RimI-like enzyme